jgi:hypothetical protein
VSGGASGGPSFHDVLALLVVSAGSVAVLGALLTLDGPAALGVVGPAAPWLGPGLLLGGAGGFLGAFLAGGRRTARDLLDLTPRLYPYARRPVQAGIYLLGVVSTAAVVSALFAEYSGALQGGDPTAVARPYVLNDLYLAASALWWVLAIWVVALIAKVVGMGRALEHARGRNVYGLVEEEGAAPAPPQGGTLPTPAPKGQPRIVVGATVAVALAAVAGIQAVEVGGDPAPAGLWFAFELLTPIWAAGVALTLLGIDRHVRELELRYSTPGSALPVVSPVPSAVDGSPGFVP